MGLSRQSRTKRFSHEISMKQTALNQVLEWSRVTKMFLHNLVASKMIPECSTMFQRNLQVSIKLQNI